MNAESQNIEFKESWRDEYVKWVCGFANAQGGKLYIGIDDKGNICGIENCHKLSEDIPNKIVALLGIVVNVNVQKSVQKSVQKILSFIEENPSITTQEVAILLGVNRSGVARHIKKLQEQGILRRVGPDNGGHWEIINRQNPI